MSALSRYALRSGHGLNVPTPTDATLERSQRDRYRALQQNRTLSGHWDTRVWCRSWPIFAPPSRHEVLGFYRGVSLRDTCSGASSSHLSAGR
jgi:hypothetical protein